MKYKLLYNEKYNYMALAAPYVSNLMVKLYVLDTDTNHVCYALETLIKRFGWEVVGEL